MDCTGSEPIEDQFFGTVTVGERGQIVIPAEARRRLDINTGDKLLVIGHPASNGILFCRVERFREFLVRFIEGLDKVENQDAGQDAGK